MTVTSGRWVRSPEGIVLLGAAEAQPDPSWLMPPVWAADPTLRRLFELAVAGKSEHEALGELGGEAELDPELWDTLKRTWNKVSGVARIVGLLTHPPDMPVVVPEPPAIVEQRRDDLNPLTGPPPPPR